MRKPAPLTWKGWEIAWITELGDAELHAEHFRHSQFNADLADRMAKWLLRFAAWQRSNGPQ